MQSSGPPYLPMFESVFVVLANGEKVKVTDLDQRVMPKVKETEKMLRRDDRSVWALRFFKKL
jgi:serine/threonine-protein kinase RIO1